MASITFTGSMIVALALVGGPAFAQQGTDAQREACTPDAFRLCMSAMPDSGRVEGCLREAGPRLSPACYAVFNPPQQAGETARDRGMRRSRDVQRRPDQRTYDQGGDYRRDDGFGGFERRDDRNRPPFGED